MKDKKALTSPCGLDCFNCEIYEDNLTNDLAELIHKRFPARVATNKTGSITISRQKGAQLWTV
jgi:hypothetical protein